MAKHSPGHSRPANKVLFTMGVLCILGAFAGGGVKWAGAELPLVGSITRQVAIGVLGAALVASSFFVRFAATPEAATTRDTVRETFRRQEPLTVWRIPAPSRNFVGREQQLSQLGERLANSPAGTPHVITGYGGVGKSRLAVEYAVRHRDDYQVALWLRSEQEVTLLHDLAAFGEEIGLRPLELSNQESAAEAVRRWLKRNPGWLCVFDQAEDVNAVTRWLPIVPREDEPAANPPCHVLVTSRNTRWSERGSITRIPVLPNQDSVTFLLKRTGQTVAKLASTLADSLGNLPLALEQAGAYMSQANLSLDAYLKLFEGRLFESFSRGEPIGDPRTVATTWDLSIEQASREASAAAELLKLCAFLAPADIPRDLFLTDVESSEIANLREHQIASVLRDPLALSDGIAALLHYSLIGSSKSALEVHRLIQEVVRWRLMSGGRSNWAGFAVTLVAGAFPSNSRDPISWSRGAELVPHALVACGHADREGAEPKVTAWLLDRAANYLQVRGQFRAADAAFSKGLEISEQLYGPDSNSVAIAQVSIGGVRRALGDLRGSRSAYEAALGIQERQFGETDSRVARTLGNLGLILRQLGLHSEAKAAFERALSIYSQTRTRDSAYGRVLLNLGRVQEQQGDSKGAGVRYQEAVEAFESARAGGQGAVAANGLTDVARALRGMGDLLRARALFEEALPIQEEIYGADHPYVAHTLVSLGGLFLDAHEAQEAERSLKRALAIQEKVYGIEHPYVAATLETLSSVWRDLGNEEQAISALRRAQQIWSDRDQDDRVRALDSALSILEMSRIGSPPGDPNGKEDQQEFRPGGRSPQDGT